MALSGAGNPTATCQTTYDGPGSPVVTATYAPSTDFLPSTGKATQTVERAATTTTLTSQAAALALPAGCGPERKDCGPDGKSQGRGAVASPIAIPSGSDTSVVGQAVTLTATVSVNAPGVATPTGSIVFADATTILGTSELSTANGVTTATWTTDRLPAGPQTITATYAGDANTLGSSGHLTQAVEYIFVGLLPPLDHQTSLRADQTAPVAFTLLDAQGQVVSTASATLDVNGVPAVPGQGKDQSSNAFRFQGGSYRYDLHVADQGTAAAGSSVSLAIRLSDGTTHTFTFAVAGKGSQDRSATNGKSRR